MYLLMHNNIHIFFLTLILLLQTMGYIEVYTQNEQNPRKYTISNVPSTLFDEPIQLITIIKIIREKNDPFAYTLTLYTKDYKINLGKTTYIYNDTNKNETIEDKKAHMNLNIYTTEFLKLTVQEMENDERLHQRIYLPLDNPQFNCDECLDRINECRQYNNNQNEYYYQMGQELKDSLRKISNCYDDNAELKEMIDSKNQESKNQENKKCNDPQSTQTTTIIIICVLIIIFLFGLCIYLYFFKQ